MMNVKLLRTLIGVGLAILAGHSWATASPAEPPDGDMTWQDVAGIQWSVNGGSWANVGSTDLYVGQSVQFKVTMHTYMDGNHYVDLIKSWIDWNGSGAYANDASETLLSGFHVVNATPDYTFDTDHVVNQSFDFLSSTILLSDAMIGDHSLLARVTCSDALLTTAQSSGLIQSPNPAYTNFWQQWNYSTADMLKWFSPSSVVAYYQGEAQQVGFTVKGNEVPEPGTLSLLAAAMVGIAWRRKQATRV